MRIPDAHRRRLRTAGPWVLDGLLASESASGRQPEDSDRQIRRSGLGIAGMRERAALYGGTLEAGPLPGRGFRVAATLPVEGPP
jgi:signal transduction histidine kinase